MATKKRKTPLVTPELAKQRHDIIDEAIRDFTGPLDELESAIGMYMIGRHFGWKVLFLIHSKKTIKKYEEFLRIKVSEEFEPYGPDADRTNAYKVLQTVSNFWKVVSGDEKIDLDREARRSTS